MESPGKFIEDEELRDSQWEQRLANIAKGEDSNGTSSPIFAGTSRNP
jgi:hypothetical protein